MHSDGNSSVQRTEQDEVFEHQGRQFYIECAKHVLNLAPLPEFKDAIAMLEMFDMEPTEENRADLENVYRLLIDERTRREYGYTAIGEFYNGLTHILACVLEDPDSILSSSVQYFAEAAWCAGHDLNCSTTFDNVADRAQRVEYEWQEQLWEELFPSPVAV